MVDMVDNALPLRRRLLSGPREFSKEDLETASHWVKQLSGLGVGLACGMAPLTGAAGMIAFVVTSLLLTWLMYSKVMRADLDIEAQTELWKEGAMAATALFLLTWTVVFTFMHPE